MHSRMIWYNSSSPRENGIISLGCITLGLNLAKTLSSLCRITCEADKINSNMYLTLGKGNLLKPSSACNNLVHTLSFQAAVPHTPVPQTCHPGRPKFYVSFD